MIVVASLVRSVVVPTDCSVLSTAPRVYGTICTFYLFASVTHIFVLCACTCVLLGCSFKLSTLITRSIYIYIYFLLLTVIVSPHLFLSPSVPVGHHHYGGEK